jgi:hypothetical protein
MNYEDLSSDMQEKARGCKTPEEIFALANEEGYELSDEELGSIAGGDIWDHKEDGCPEYLKDDCNVWR